MAQASSSIKNDISLAYPTSAFPSQQHPKQHQTSERSKPNQYLLTKQLNTTPPATMFRQTFARNLRLFSTQTALRQNKGPIEGAKEAVKQVDRTVSDTIVKGIEKGGKDPFLPRRTIST